MGRVDEITKKFLLKMLIEMAEEDGTIHLDGWGEDRESALLNKFRSHLLTRGEPMQ